MASSLGFERANIRARDGLHRSANREDRQELAERRRQGHDIQIAIGRWVLPRVRGNGIKTQIIQWLFSQREWAKAIIANMVKLYCPIS